MSVKISDLGNIPNPLDGTELLEIVQSVSGVPQSRNVTTAQLGLFAGGTITGTGIRAPTAGLPYDYDANLSFQNANALQTAQIGWNGASQFRVQLEAWGAEYAVRGFDNVGNAKSGMDIDFDGSVRLYDNGGGAASELNATTGPAATGGLFVNNLLTGAGLERVLTTSDLGGPATIIIEDEGAPVGVPADTLDFVGAGVTVTGAGTTKTVTIPGGGGVTFPIIAADNDEIRWGTGNDWQQYFDGTDLRFDRTPGLTSGMIVSSSTNGSGPLLDLRQEVLVPESRLWFTNTNTGQGFNIAFTPNTGSLLFYAGNDSYAQQQLKLFVSGQAVGGVSIYTDASLLRLQTRTEGTQFTEGVYLIERAAAGADIPASGQFWVRNDVPNTPMFTDDAGTDFELNATASVPDPLIISSINVTSALSPTTGGSYVNCPINIGANLTGTMPMTVLARQRIQNHTSSFAFGGTLFINIDGGDVIIGGLNGANVTVDYNNRVELQHGTSPTVVARTETPANGGFEVNNLATGAGLERVLTTSDIGGISPPIVLLDNEQIQFGTGTDVTMEWDGTNFDIAFPLAAAQPLRIRDGAQVRFLTPNDADYTFIQQLADRTNILSTAGAGFWQFQPELRIINDLTFGTGGTASLSVTGTDLNIDVSALSDIRMRSGTDLHFEATANGSVALYYDNARRFETQAINTDGNVSGATIDDAGGVQVDVGFNVMQWRQENAVVGTTSNEWREHAGHNMFQDDGAARTWTLPASTDAVVPDGAIIDVTNLGAGNLTIAEGAGVTLTWLDGSTGGTGNRTIAQWGIATLTKRSATQWYIFGSGIS